MVSQQLSAVQFAEDYDVARHVVVSFIVGFIAIVVACVVFCRYLSS